MGQEPTGAEQLVDGRYRLLDELGRGGMGRVWRAHDLRLNRTVALKELLLPDELSEEERTVLATRMRREAQAAAMGAHPSIVTVHDVVEDDGRPWIVMELLSGRSLQELVRDEGPQSPEQVAQWGLGVLDALATAHRVGILHRDVKPANIMITDNGRAVLTDFGIALIEGDTSLTRTTGLVGSPGYLAPERLELRPATAKADLWSLGAVLYQALTGRSPFRRPTLQETVDAIRNEPVPDYSTTDTLATVIDGLLRKDPAARIDAGETRRLLTLAGATGAVSGPNAATGAAAAGGALAASGPQTPVTGPAPGASAGGAAGAAADGADPDHVPTEVPTEDLAATEASAAAGPEESGSGESGSAASGPVAPASPDAPTVAGTPATTVSPTEAGTPATAVTPTEVGPGSGPDAPTEVAPAAADSGRWPPTGPQSGHPAYPGSGGDHGTTLNTRISAPYEQTPWPGSAGGQGVPGPYDSPSNYYGMGPTGTGGQRPVHGVPVPPPAPPGRDRNGSSGMSWPTAVTVLGIAILAAAMVAFFVYVPRGGDDISPSSNDGSASPENNAAAGDDSGEGDEKSGATESDKGGQDEPKKSSAPKKPKDDPDTAGGVQSDSAGFDIKVPEGWTRRADGRSVFYDSPDGNSYLQVDQRPHPTVDQPKHIAASEQDNIAAGRLPDYQQVRIDEVTGQVPGAQSAVDWEFTWNRNGEPRHVLSRNITVNEDRFATVAWATPGDQWSDMESLGIECIESFEAR